MVHKIIQKLGYFINFILLKLNPNVTLHGFVKIDWGVEFLIDKEAKLILGNNVQIRHNSVIASFGKGILEIEDNVFIAHGVTFMATKHIIIGSGSMIAEYSSIRDADHDYASCSDQPLYLRPSSSADIIIGKNVWVAAKATLIKGITLGEGAVIGANSVVTTNIPARCVAVGAPAKVIKEYPAC